MNNKLYNYELNRFEANEYPIDPGIKLIEASAGTGKTFALAHLVLRLISEKRIPISKILIVTFTEAAASELKNRICARLTNALNNITNSNKSIINDNVMSQWLKGQSNSQESIREIGELINKALENIDSADITTIHGFCSRTLKNQAIISGCSIKPQIEIDNHEIITEVAHEYWKNEILSLDIGDITGLKDAGLSLDRTIEMVKRIDNDPTGAIRTEDSYFNREESLKTQFGSLNKKVWKEFKSLWIKQGELLERELCSRAQYWRDKGLHDIKPFSPKPRIKRALIINEWIEQFNNVEFESRRTSIPNYGEIRSQKLLGTYFHPAVFSVVERRADNSNPILLKESLQKSIATIWDYPAEETWIHALNYCLIELKNRRKKQGLMTYGDLLTTLDPGQEEVLENNNIPELKKLRIKNLRSRYKVALIDEFQDTDSIQWRILKGIFGDSIEHLLIMVGDPKQAIYSFRGGDLNTYIKAKERALRIDALLDNYRTHNKLLNGLNTLMKNGLIRSNLVVPQLKACAEGKDLESETKGYPLQIIGLDSDSKDIIKLKSKSELEELIPGVVTKLVINTLNSNTNDIVPKDVCILVNRHDQAEKIREDLSKKGISTQLTSKGDVLQTKAAEFLQLFLDCISDPADISNLKLFACSPLLEWTKEDLINSELNGDIEDLTIKFKYFSKAFHKIGIIGCMSELLQAVKKANLMQKGRFLGDLDQCCQLIQEEIYNKGLDPYLASKWLKRERQNAEGNPDESRRINSDVVDNAVKVMTIHRSKGLEYKAVICPYLWQSPPAPTGPIWKSEGSQPWIIALNKDWDKGALAFQNANETRIKEAERLAYVAMTRAKSLLMIIWCNGAKQDGNPLRSLLFGPDSIHRDIEEDNSHKLNSWLLNNNIGASFIPSSSIKEYKNWLTPEQHCELSLGPSPKRKLDKSWARHSYSSWIQQSRDDLHEQNLLKSEEGRDTEEPQEDKLKLEIDEPKTTDEYDAKKTLLFREKSPLSDFPRGSAAGECLHRILQQLDFTVDSNSKESTEIIIGELLRSNINQDHLTTVQNGIKRILTTPLGGELNNFKLNELDNNRRISELSFDMPIGKHAGRIQARDLVKAFKTDLCSRFSNSYTDKLEELDIDAHGFLTGSIDLVFCDKKDPIESSWWVIDWKSNWIGEQDEEGQELPCSPIYYSQNAMEKQMISHHYPLQAHIYLVALHRFLNWRLKSYNPNKNLGGYIYMFLRGVPGEEPINGNSFSTPGIIIEPAPIKRVIAIDKLLDTGCI